MMIADAYSHDHSEEGHSHDNDIYSDNGKEDVRISVPEFNVAKLRSSIYGLCLHSLFDGITLGSGISATNPQVLKTLFGAILLHKISASLGVGIFIRQQHIPFKQGTSVSEI